MNDNKKYLMILERSGENLAVDKKNDDYVLEGVFAQFGVENNNNRIYEEKEYLPHLDYLKKKISENRLLGELDHPDKFDISLSKVSHLIEEIKYDPKKRQIVGKIKLLNTPSGLIAKNLVDTGVPISISSRAAGVVGENKKVQIKRIFTYDLVADPGFENAQMTKINESLGFENDDNLIVYDVTKEFPAFFESLESSEIYKPNEKIKEKNMSSNEFVTVDDMNRYSIIIKEELERLGKRVGSSSSNSIDEERLSELEDQVAKLRKYANYLAESQNKMFSYGNYLGEKLDDSIRYSEMIAEKADKGIQYSEMIAEKADKGIQYSEMIAERQNSSLKYSDYLAEKLDQAIQYGEYKANKIDEMIDFTNYISTKLNETVLYTEHIAEHADNAIRYGEYLAENVATQKDFKNLTEYTEYMFENNGMGERSSDRKNSRINESISNRYNNLDNKIDEIIDSVKKQKMDERANDARFPFIKFLGEEKRNEFFSLSEAEKKRVANALNSKPSFKEDQIVKVWESALSNVEVNEKWLVEMPVEYISLWENSSYEIKDRITRQAKLYNLDTPYQIKNFWQTRGLGKTDQAVFESLNESRRVETNESLNNPLGYSFDYVKNVSEGLNRFKKR